MNSGADSRPFDRRALWSGALALLYLGTLFFTPLHLLLETHSHEFPSEMAQASHHAEEDHHEGEDHEHHAHPATDHELALAQPAKFSLLDAPFLATLSSFHDGLLRRIESVSVTPMDTGPPEHSPPRAPAQPRSPPLV